MGDAGDLRLLFSHPASLLRHLFIDISAVFGVYRLIATYPLYKNYSGNQTTIQNFSFKHRSQAVNLHFFALFFAAQQDYYGGSFVWLAGYAE